MLKTGRTGGWRVGYPTLATPKHVLEFADIGRVRGRLRLARPASLRGALQEPAQDVSFLR